MTHYINKFLYTDVHSWKVLEINDAQTEATIIEVKKEFKPEIILGGFVGHCVNNSDQRNGEVVEVKGATPFRVVKKGDVWGYWTLDFTQWNRDFLKDDYKEHAKNNGAEAVDVEIDGKPFVNIYELTPSGRRKQKFVKLGKMSDTCHYFYDYNF